MAGRDEWDLVLFGYRNELARERVLQYLATVPGVPTIDRQTKVPQRLFAQLPAARAHQLEQELEALGAQIAVVPVLPPTAPAPERPARSRVRWLAAIVGGGAAAGLAFVLLPHHRPALETRAPQARVERVAEFMRIEVPPPDEPAREPDEAAQLNASAVADAERGQFEAAAEQLRRAMRLAPDNEVVRQNLQTVLHNWAVQVLDRGDAAAALARVQEALALGERGNLRFASGMANMRAGDLGAARADLEQALANGITDANLYLALGEVYLHDGDRPRALEMLHRAREAGAGGPELAALVDRLEREVDAEWDFAAMENRHFRVTFAEGENRVAAQLVLDGLEDARNDIAAKFFAVPSSVTEVVLYAAQDFHAITKTPDWAGGAYDGRIKVPVRGLEANDPGLPRLLRHEFMHRVAAEISNNRCPVWLSEGLAVWAEEDQEGERRTWAEETVRGGPLFRLEQLSDSLTGLPSDRAQIAYAQSYLAVRELIDRYGARRLPLLVTELSRQPLPAAFAAVYPGDFADFEARWLRSLQS
jgi:tetratricopeptide (TPR) repeat protein